MPAKDIHSIFMQTRFGRNVPFLYQEVIDYGHEPISGREYLPNGHVTEFRYGRDLGRVFKENRIDWLNKNHAFGEAWGFFPSNRAIAFVDNHDTQRSNAREVLTMAWPMSPSAP